MFVCVYDVAPIAVAFRVFGSIFLLALPCNGCVQFDLLAYMDNRKLFICRLIRHYVLPFVHAIQFLSYVYHAHTRAKVCKSACVSYARRYIKSHLYLNSFNFSMPPSSSNLAWIVCTTTTHAHTRCVYGVLYTMHISHISRTESKMLQNQRTLNFIYKWDSISSFLMYIFVWI